MASFDILSHFEINSVEFLGYLFRSFSEHNVRRIVISALDHMKIDYEEDYVGNIFSLIPETPLISAHMDQICLGDPSRIFPILDGDIIFANQGTNLGADDKNGVFICLNLLSRFKIGELSFIFSSQEESGCVGIKALSNYYGDVLSKLLYGLVFDRKGKSDVLTSGAGDKFASPEFIDALKIFMVKEFAHFTPSTFGSISDTCTLSKYISCVNISCGYYASHTKDEFVLLGELYNTLEFGYTIIKKLARKHYKPVKDIYSGTIYNNFDNYGYAQTSRAVGKKRF